MTPLRQFRFVRPVLCLTLGPQVGWALRWDAEQVASGVQPFGWEPATFRRWLRDLLALSEARLVAWERPERTGLRPRRRSAAALRLEGVLMAELEGRRHLVTAPRSMFALHVTGHGSPGNQALVAAARARWSREVAGPQEASALCLLAWVIDMTGEARSAS